MTDAVPIRQLLAELTAEIRTRNELEREKRALEKEERDRSDSRWKTEQAERATREKRFWKTIWLLICAVLVFAGIKVADVLDLWRFL